MHKPHTMRRLSSSQGKGGYPGPPKGGDRNWYQTGPPGSQAWPQGSNERRVTDTDVLPPPGLTPKNRTSSAHRMDYGNFNSRGEGDPDRRRSRGGTRRHRSEDRTRHHGRKTSDRRSREGHRTRSRRNKDRKKRRGVKKERRSSRTDSTSSFTSVTKRSAYSGNLAAVEPEIKHPQLLGMERAAFEQRIKECPDFVRVVHNFIQHEHLTRGVNRGEVPCDHDYCTHMLPWAVPWTVGEEEIRARDCYSQAGQKAAYEMFVAMQEYLSFFVPAPGAPLQAQVPAGTGRGGEGEGLPCLSAFSRFTTIFFIYGFFALFCAV